MALSALNDIDDTQFNNILTEDVINAWYEGVAPGTTGVNVPATFNSKYAEYMVNKQQN